MKIRYFIFLLLLSIVVQAQNITVKHFSSTVLGKNRDIKIYLPPTYEKDSTRYYPITVLLDSDFMFDLYLGNMNVYTQRDFAPEQILVGISQSGKNERTNDSSYDKVDSKLTAESSKFYRFVGGELLDYMEENYRISPFRTIAGTTVTANFVNYFLLEPEPIFDAYICINPAYSPDMQSLLESKFAKYAKSQIYYYVNSGKYNSVEQQKAIDAVGYGLKNIENPNLFVKYDLFDTATKTSSIGIGVAAAIAHIFSMYTYISPEEYDKNIKHLNPPQAIDYLKKKYVDIEYLFGTNLKIRERDIYAIEGIIIDQESGKYLAEFGKMIEDLYPESPLSDYYKGMFFEKQGKYSIALKHYKNGYVKLGENSNDAEAFYQNILRVQGREDDKTLMRDQQEQIKQDLKEAEEERKQSEKEKKDK